MNRYTIHFAFSVEPSHADKQSEQGDWEDVATVEHNSLREAIAEVRAEVEAAGNTFDSAFAVERNGGPMHYVPRP